MPSAVGYQPTLATEMGDLQERITSTKTGSITSVQAVYVPADDLTILAGELLSNMEVLAKELLHLTCAVNDDFLIFRELVHTKNCDDVLEVLVVLQDLLNANSNAVVLFANDLGIESARAGLQRVNSRMVSM